MGGAGRERATPPSPDEVTAAARAGLAPGEAGWLVGGCLRDELLGLPVKDIDIVLDGDTEPFARRLADRLGGAVFAASEAFGMWRIVLGGVHVDVAPLRGPAPRRAACSRRAPPGSMPTCGAATSPWTPWRGRWTAASWSTR